MKSDLDALDEFLLKVANADRVGIRVKIKQIKKFIAALENKAKKDTNEE